MAVIAAAFTSCSASGEYLSLGKAFRRKRAIILLQIMGNLTLESEKHEYLDFWNESGVLEE